MAAIVRADLLRPARDRADYVRDALLQFDALLQPRDVVAQARDGGVEFARRRRGRQHRIFGDEVVRAGIEHALGKLAPVRGAQAHQSDDALCRRVADEARQFLLGLGAQVLQHEGQRLREVGIAFQRDVAQRRLRITECQRQRGEIEPDRDHRLGAFGIGETATVGDLQRQRKGRRLESRDAPGERCQPLARPALARQHAVEHGEGRRRRELFDHAASLRSREWTRKKGAPRRPFRSTAPAAAASGQLLDTGEHPAAAPADRLHQVPHLRDALDLAIDAQRAVELHAGDMLVGIGLDAEQFGIERHDFGARLPGRVRAVRASAR